MIQSALVQQAINAALQSEWQAAIDLNLKLLDQDPEDLDSLNRLARAYLEVGDIAKSKKLYNDVVSLDPYNTIASKNLKRFELIKGSTASVKNKISKAVPYKSIAAFIEEPGKTKVVQLVRPATPNSLFLLHSGERVKLSSKGRGIQIVTESDVYVGRLADDLAFQLQFFIKNGNEYEVYVKQVLSNGVFVFIKETVRDEKFAHRPTFSITNESAALSENQSKTSDEGSDNFDEENEHSSDDEN
ncbi:MAG: tetratricopeptide repeat protein [bacterium]|nr:tetratricopeptide repeat protein [bacterium]